MAGVVRAGALLGAAGEAEVGAVPEGPAPAPAVLAAASERSITSTSRLAMPTCSRVLVARLEPSSQSSTWERARCQQWTEHPCGTERFDRAMHSGAWMVSVSRSSLLPTCARRSVSLV